MSLFRRNPAFACATTVTLALAVGGTVALFSVIYGLLLRPLAVPEADRVVIAYLTDNRFLERRGIISYPHFRQWQASGAAFERLAAMTPQHFDVTGEGPAERMDAAVVTLNFFDALRVRPLIGRTFTEADANGAPCVIAFSVWQKRFSADPAIVGRVLKAGDLSFTIIGVMPPAFQRWRGSADLWVPIDAVPETASLRDKRGYFLYTVVGRLKPDATIMEAESQLTGAVRRMPNESRYGDRYGAQVVSLRKDVVTTPTRRLLTLVGIMVLLVWTIACANVGGLLIARTTDRVPELAIRMALGATNGRLIRQLLAESVVVAGAGAIGGLLLAQWIVGLLVLYGPAAIARDDLIRLDAASAAAAAVIAAATTIAIALGSIGQIARRRVLGMLQEARGRVTATRRGNRVHDALVTLEVAVAVVVLTGAGLVVRSFWNLERVNLGFDPSSVLSLRIALPSRYAGPAGVSDVAGAIEEALESVPGVRDVSFASDLPVPNTGSRSSITIENGPVLLNGNPQDKPLTPGKHVVTPGFFRTLGIRLARGRGFVPADDATGVPVAIVNEEMARMHWPGADAIGQRLSFGLRNRDGSVDEPWITIVGVTTNPRFGGPDVLVKPEVYIPLAQSRTSSVFVLIKTTGDPLEVAQPARQRISGVDIDIPMFDVRTLGQRVADVTAESRYRAGVVGAFGLLAIVLTAAGLYAVLAQRVARRRRELAVRIALGAERRDLMRLVIAHAARLVLPAMVIGLAVASVLSRWLGSQLFGISAGDPLTSAGVATGLLIVTALAGYVPARRASRADPMIALRAE